MMRRAVYTIIGLLILCSSLCAQQVTEPLNPVWLQNDLDGVKFLVQLMPVESHTIPELKKRFKTQIKTTSWFDESNLGFGVRRVKLNMGLGYTTIYIDFLLFKNKIVHYTIGADVSEKVWRTNHSDDVKRVWKQNGGPLFNEKTTELTFDKDYPEVWKAYDSYLTARLGRKEYVLVPDSLKASYELLTNAFENSSISVVACDNGKPAIDELEATGRVDLIENVLRGRNPGGRIYAAISLLRMKQKRKQLSSATQRAINRVLISDADASTCRGDTGMTGLRARDIVWEYVRSKEW